MDAKRAIEVACSIIEAYSAGVDAPIEDGDCWRIVTAFNALLETWDEREAVVKAAMDLNAPELVRACETLRAKEAEEEK